MIGLSRRYRRIAVTGGLAAGKSTVARLLAGPGVRLFDADAAARAVIGKDGSAAAAVNALMGDLSNRQAVDRRRLRAWVAARPERLSMLSRTVHPYVEAEMSAAVRRAAGRTIICDIPLLFEVGWEDRFDWIIAIHAPSAVRRARARRRAGMGGALFDRLDAAQASTVLKRRFSDRSAPTTLGFRDMRRRLDRIAPGPRSRRVVLAPRHRRVLKRVLR